VKNRNIYLRVLYTRPIGTHYLPPPVSAPIGTPLPPNLCKISMPTIGRAVGFLYLLVLFGAPFSGVALFVYSKSTQTVLLLVGLFRFLLCLVFLNRTVSPHYSIPWC